MSSYFDLKYRTEKYQKFIGKSYFFLTRFNFSVQNGPSFGKSIATSFNFCAHISSAANRIRFIDSSKNEMNFVAAEDVITDMVFAPTASDTLITASRDKNVSLMVFGKFNLVRLKVILEKSKMLLYFINKNHKELTIVLNNVQNSATFGTSYSLCKK